MDNKKFITTGAVVGIGAMLLSYYGNPPNTGLCISCFMRSTAGAIGLHDNIRLQYIRPEIMAIVLESQHGLYAAEVADFFADLHTERGDGSRSRAWANVAKRIRHRERERFQQA